ncbi:MAG: enoyl-CoA hydratase/isomerase family protein [Candidatus Bathyarchaeota archaeon]|nr:enoyl-CoA hydratase/isomerase family protein [Candidatus Bathyarchaeota archaeon]MDH5688665.1 enoyl-CoA hydratase/isomerase family protein [Candidatus Bathyarchaeota archaeon]
MSFGNILLEKKDGVAEITVNRPPLNILNIETLRELNMALKAVKKDDSVSIVILKGAGQRAFSAGVDIRDHMPENVEELLEAFHGIFFSLKELDRPTIAVVDGYALGGGCEVAAACDIVIASEKSEFGQPEIDAGVFPPPATVLFPKLIGSRKALELILTGDRIDAKEAERIGLVNRVVPAIELQKVVGELVEKLREKSPIVLRLTRKAIHHAFDLDFEEGLAGVTDIYLESLMNTEDAVEGLKAFLEKRKPNWKGK